MILHRFDEPVRGIDGRLYTAQACARQREDDGLYEGFVEFVDSFGVVVFRTDRETTQPNHTDVAYWATGLSHVYLEGALSRARLAASLVDTHFS